MFEKRLKELRKAAHLTQDKLGEMAQISGPAVCKYEKGGTYPPLDKAIYLAKALKTDLNTLAGYDEYIVSDNDEKYGIDISKEEIKLLLELRLNKRLYNDLIDRPRRTIALIMKKY